MKRKKLSSSDYIMQAIDNGDLNIYNIACKIQMIKALLEKLKTEPVINFLNNKEIQRIQIRLNNYSNKFDWWKITRDDHLINS